MLMMCETSFWGRWVEGMRVYVDGEQRQGMAVEEVGGERVSTLEDENRLWRQGR